MESPHGGGTEASHMAPNCYPMSGGLTGQGVETCTESALKCSLHRSSHLPLPS